MNEFSADLKERFAIDTEIFDGLFEKEEAVGDIEMDYNISGVGDFHLTVFDSTFFVQAVEFFRPIIRGFLVLMMALYNIKQLIGFFGYDSGVVTGRSEGIAEAKKAQKE